MVLTVVHGEPIIFVRIYFLHAGAKQHRIYKSHDVMLVEAGTCQQFRMPAASLFAEPSRSSLVSSLAADFCGFSSRPLLLLLACYVA